MPRLKVIEKPDGRTAELYDASRSAFGTVFNLFKGLANAPLALDAYMTLDGLIAQGDLSPAERDIVRLVASQLNGCTYCLAAHTMTAGMNGVDDQEILAARRGEPTDPRFRALARFTRRVIETRGFVEDAEIEAFRGAGFTDGHIAEVCTILAQKTLSNLFNHINETELDFPAAPEL